MAVTVSFFDDTSVPEFREYRKLKHEVFVLEQGWQLPVDADGQHVEPDPFDPHSMFVIGRVDGSAIGIARATMIDEAFPHADFFVGLMRRPEIKGVRAAVATVNAVAVLPAFRGRPMRVLGSARTMTTAKALMVELIRRLEREGTEIVLLTTSPGIAAVFFDHLGFYVLGPTFKSAGRTLINMGLGIHDSHRFNEIGSPLALEAFTNGSTEAEDRCIGYFREQASAVLGAKSMEEFCSKQLASLPYSAGATWELSQGNGAPDAP
ncbi:MAG: hypothetical protein QNJ62_12050 [Methyloceanibacter sp.]|nr:hypothetical protein [Methyloceanibacter sp.]